MEFTDGRFVVERETENWAETLAVPAPLLVTMTRAEKELRFASIRGKMKARKTEIPVKTAADLGLDVTNVGLKASPTRVIKVFTPEVHKVDTQIIKEEDVDAAVDKLVEKLIEAGVVKRWAVYRGSKSWNYTLHRLWKLRGNLPYGRYTGERR